MCILGLKKEVNLMSIVQVVAFFEPAHNRGFVEHRASAGLLPRTHELAERDAVQCCAAEAAAVHSGLLCAAMAGHGPRAAR